MVVFVRVLLHPLPRSGAHPTPLPPGSSAPGLPSPLCTTGLTFSALAPSQGPTTGPLGCSRHTHIQFHHLDVLFYGLIMSLHLKCRLTEVKGCILFFDYAPHTPFTPPSRPNCAHGGPLQNFPHTLACGPRACCWQPCPALWC